MVKIIQRRVKHAKVLPCVFFIPLRMRVRDNIIILYTEVDSKHFRLLQPFILKGFTTVPQLCPKQIFLLFYACFQSF
jgi:hypothetical protein